MSRLPLDRLAALAISATPKEMIHNPRVIAPVKGLDERAAMFLIDQLPEYWDPEDTSLIDALVDIEPTKILSAMMRKKVISARIVLHYMQSGKIKANAAMCKKIFNYLKKKKHFMKEDQELLNFVLQNPSIPVVRELLTEHSPKLNTEQVKLCMNVFAEKRGIVLIPWAIQYDYSPNTLDDLATHAKVLGWAWVPRGERSKSLGPIAYNPREVLKYAHELFQSRKDLPVPPSCPSYEDERLLARTYMWNKEGQYLLTPDIRYTLATSSSPQEVKEILKPLQYTHAVAHAEYFIPELEMNPNLKDVITSKSLAEMVFYSSPTWPVLNVIEKKFGDYAVKLVEDYMAARSSYWNALPSSLSTIIRYPSANLVKRLGPNSCMYGHVSSGALIKATLRVYNEGIQADSKLAWSAVGDLLKGWEGSHEELLDTASALA